jgi:hypothetical protein
LRRNQGISRINTIAADSSESPHLADQTDMYSRKAWLSGHFCADAVQVDPSLSILDISE